jgi:predicted transcriptional regulator
VTDATKDADSVAVLRDMGQYLIALAESVEVGGAAVPASGIPLLNTDSAPQVVDDLPSLYSLARKEYHERDRRRSYFDPELFGEPGWDILLDLFISKAKGQRISITSACIGSRVPPTTALRWLAALESQGLISRTGDIDDKRRNWVELTDTGFRAMRNCLRDRLARQFGFAGDRDSVVPLSVRGAREDS